MTEIPLKQWVMEQAVREQAHPRTVYGRLYEGRYGSVTLRKVNQRVVFIDAGFRPAFPPPSFPGELRLNKWITQEARRTGRSRGTVYRAFYRNKYPLTVRKVNAHVTFVKAK